MLCPTPSCVNPVHHKNLPGHCQVQGRDCKKHAGRQEIQEKLENSDKLRLVGDYSAHESIQMIKTRVNAE